MNTQYINGYKVLDYSNIYIIENVLDLSFCDYIVKIIDILPKIYIKHKPHNNVQCYISYSNEILSNYNEYFCFYPNLDNYNENFTPILTNNINGVKLSEINNIKSKINNILENISSIINEKNKYVSIKYISGLNFRKIYGETRQHCDCLINVHNSNITAINNNDILSDYKMVRNASIIFTLNDNYEGGEFYFPIQGLKIKMKKGSVVIFPPYWTHPHEVSSVLNGTFRYTINTWSCENLL